MRPPGRAYRPKMLRVTHTSSVTEDQIDHLGHMNVRFYAVNAHAGMARLLADLPGWGERPHVVHDTYTRHFREQLLGAPLEVRSGILTADRRGLRVHHELANQDTGDRAATFVHTVSPLDADGRRLPLPEDVAAAALAEAVPQPEYAQPRSLSLDADLLTVAPAVDLLLERGLAMRKPRRVTPEECDADGRYRVEMAPMLTWGGERVGSDPDEMLVETSEGVLLGWATMETRVQMGELPRVGDRIQSFGAQVALADKTIHRVQWAYDLDSGALLTAFEFVGLAFDVRNRCAVRIPDGYRARALERLQPDLAPEPR
jgi:acyl-CoA thioesterase FadM